MNKIVLVAIVLVVGGIGFYVWNSNMLPGFVSSGADRQPPALPE